MLHQMYSECFLVCSQMFAFYRKKPTPITFEQPYCTAVQRSIKSRTRPLALPYVYRTFLRRSRVSALPPTSVSFEHHHLALLVQKVEEPLPLLLNLSIVHVRLHGRPAGQFLEGSTNLFENYKT